MIMIGIADGKAIEVTNRINTGRGKPEFVTAIISVIFQHPGLGCFDPEIGIQIMIYGYFGKILSLFDYSKSKAEIGIGIIDAPGTVFLFAQLLKTGTSAEHGDTDIG